MSELSVIIPTRCLDGRILKTAYSLHKQDAGLSAMEIILVSDGGGVEYKTAEELHRLFAGLIIIEIKKSGPAAARNAGLARASGRLVLFTGDDIIFSPGAFRAHLLAHRGLDKPGAVCGSTVFDPSLRRTPFMDYLSGAGPQFDPERFPDGAELPFGYFITANLSVDSRLIRDIGGFDANYGHPALEDTDYGYRAARKGYKLYYAKAAAAAHCHAPSLTGFAQRERHRGEALRYFICKFPELAEKEGISVAALKKYRRLASSGAVSWMAGRAALLEGFINLMPASIRRRIYKGLLDYQVLKGYADEPAR